MKDQQHISTVIIDDEVAFINTLQIMLKPFDAFKVIGEARSVKEGVALIELLSPDLIFLDVEMEDGTGFDVLKALKNLEDVKVIFVTAFDHYAVQAFRYSAIDYLLKPVVREDLHVSLEKSKHAILQDQLDLRYKILLDNIQQKQEEKKRIVLKEMSAHHIIKIDDILMCHAEGSYTRFYFENGETLIASKHLKEYESLLPSNKFFRVHRSYLINLDKVIKYERSEGGIIMLKGGQQIPVSVRKRENLTSILSELN